MEQDMMTKDQSFVLVFIISLSCVLPRVSLRTCTCSTPYQNPVDFRMDWSK